MESVFLNGLASKVESIINNYNLGYIITKCKYVVNPLFTGIVSKVIILNLPWHINLGRLSLYNKIISRFPLDGLQYELIPYELPENPKKIEKTDYSLLILNRYMMSELDSIIETEDTDYLLGLDSHIDGYLTSIGYKLVSTDLNKFT